MKYELNFFFEYGMEEASIWCGNDNSFSRFEAGPVSFEKLGLSEELKKILTELGDEFQDSLDWEYPPDPSPWSKEHKEDFLKRSRLVYNRLVEELGDEYSVKFLVTLPD